MTKMEKQMWLSIYKNDLRQGGLRTTVKEAKKMAKYRAKCNYASLPVEYPILSGGCLVCEKTKRGLRYTRLYENSRRMGK